MAEILRCEERRLAGELTGIRAKFDHSGNKGALAETAFRNFLRKYMPGNASVGHGEVFDIDGRLSKQTDIVVANEYHVALQSDWEEPQRFTIEAVQCAAEVKSSLTDIDSLRDCVDKARAFKRLLVAPEKSAIYMSMGDDERRFLDRRPYFTFAFESRLTLDTIYDALNAWDSDLRDVERPALDGLFVLDRGVLIHLGTGKGKLVMKTDDGQRVSGYVGFDKDGGVLSRLLLWMYGAMPRIIEFQHPVFPYLQPRTESGNLWLNDRGEIERRPSNPGSIANNRARNKHRS